MVDHTLSFLCHETEVRGVGTWKVAPDPEVEPTVLIVAGSKCDTIQLFTPKEVWKKAGMVVTTGWIPDQPQQPASRGAWADQNDEEEEEKEPADQILWHNGKEGGDFIEFKPQYTISDIQKSIFKHRFSGFDFIHFVGGEKESIKACLSNPDVKDIVDFHKERNRGFGAVDSGVPILSKLGLLDEASPYTCHPADRESCGKNIYNGRTGNTYEESQTIRVVTARDTLMVMGYSFGVARLLRGKQIEAELISYFDSSTSEKKVTGERGGDRAKRLADSFRE